MKKINRRLQNYLVAITFSILFFLPKMTISQTWYSTDRDPLTLKTLQNILSSDEEIIGIRNLNSNPALLILIKNSIKKAGFLYEANIIQMSLNEELNDDEGTSMFKVLCDCNNSRLKIVAIGVDTKWHFDNNANWVIAVGDSVASRMLNSVCSKL